MYNEEFRNICSQKNFSAQRFSVSHHCPDYHRPDMDGLSLSAYRFPLQHLCSLCRIFCCMGRPSMNYALLTAGGYGFALFRNNGWYALFLTFFLLLLLLSRFSITPSVPYVHTLRILKSVAPSIKMVIYISL